MLKIRISGSESELKKVAHKAENSSIQRFNRGHGKTSFAIDIQISVEDFVNNLNLSSDNQFSNHNNMCNAQKIQTELESLLVELSAK
ncbi:MAG: hypothetical protein KAI02_02160 [Gammaproteobacteria bacterium]|nr:hypothetical protein [Gammaproteobacteria bacterium]